MATSSSLSRSAAACIVFCIQIIIYSTLVYAARARLPYGVGFGPFTWSSGTADVIQMWSVGLAGLVTEISINRSLKGVAFRGAAPKYFAIAGLVPLIYCAAVYVPCWLIGIATFKGPHILLYGFAATIAHLPAHLATSLGEEIGWRGSLTPNLTKIVGPVWTGLLCGLVWAAWHYGDIIFFGYNVGTPWPCAIFCFTISVIGMAMFLTWLRLRSNSIWPAVLFHGAHNSIIYGIFERATEAHANTALVTSEFGVGLAVAGAILGALSWRALTGVKRAQVQTL